MSRIGAGARLARHCAVDGRSAGCLGQPSPRPRMLHIDRIDLREIHLALKEPFRISSGVESTRRILLLEIAERDGASAWAECVAGAFPNYSPETIDTAWLAIREWLAPRLFATALPDAAAVHELLAENI